MNINVMSISEFIEKIIRRIDADSSGPAELLIKIISILVMVFVIIVVFNLIQS